MFINQRLVLIDLSCSTCENLVPIPLKFGPFQARAFTALLTPGARLIALDQSRQEAAAPGVIDSERNGSLHMGVVGATGSYYLVFLVPGAGNLILYHAFYFLLVWGNKPSMSSGGADEG